MPEMPENETLARFLDTALRGTFVRDLEIGSITSLKTVDPTPAALRGQEILGAGRRGKHIVIDISGTYLVLHLFLAGWLTWSDKPPRSPLAPGRGRSRAVARLTVADERGADAGTLTITEAGTMRRLSLWLVTDLDQIPGIAELGPEALDLADDPTAWAQAFGHRRSQLKTVLRDQRVLAGIGNAYSDEILHAAQLSPYTPASSLTPETTERLRQATITVLKKALFDMAGAPPSKIKTIKKDGFAVHARAGQPCPVCGDQVRSVEYSQRSFEYCPTCQTGGKLLADRATSRFVK